MMCRNAEKISSQRKQNHQHHQFTSERDKNTWRVRFLLVMFGSRGRSDEFENHESKS